MNYNTDSLKLTVNTAIDNTTIKQEFVDVAGQMHRWVMDTRETQIREALIKLGWTPPSSASQTMNHDIVV